MTSEFIYLVRQKAYYDSREEFEASAKLYFSDPHSQSDIRKCWVK